MAIDIVVRRDVERETRYSALPMIFSKVGLIGIKSDDLCPD